MKTLIIEIPVTQNNEDADSADAANTINLENFVSIKHLTERLLSLNIDKFYHFSVQDIVSHVNNGNDSFSDSYLAEVYIG